MPQLGFVPRTEAALLARSLRRKPKPSGESYCVEPGVGRHRPVKEQMCAFYLSFCSHTQNTANNRTRREKNTMKWYDILGKVRVTKHQPTDQRTSNKMFGLVSFGRLSVGHVPGEVYLTRMKPVSHRSIGTRRVGSGPVGRCSKSHGSGWVDSTSFQISRVGLSWVSIFSNLAGRVGSGHKVFKISRVKSGRVETYQNFSGSGDPSRPVRLDLTREKAWKVVYYKSLRTLSAKNDISY